MRQPCCAPLYSLQVLPTFKWDKQTKRNVPWMLILQFNFQWRNIMTTQFELKHKPENYQKQRLWVKKSRWPWWPKWLSFKVHFQKFSSSNPIRQACFFHFFNSSAQNSVVSFICGDERSTNLEFLISKEHWIFLWLEWGSQASKCDQRSGKRSLNGKT